MSDLLSEEQDLICKCFQVKEETIRKSIANDNLKTVEQVTQACEAGGGCQSCHILLQLFIDQHYDRFPKTDELETASQAEGKKKGKGFFKRLFS
jgi:NifU-like protein